MLCESDGNKSSVGVLTAMRYRFRSTIRWCEDRAHDLALCGVFGINNSSALLSLPLPIIIDLVGVSHIYIIFR